MDTGTVSERVLNVREATFGLLRDLGLTTVFGNPGSTEETFLADFPDDFRFVLALQEASVIAIADGFAQASRAPALVNVHTATGMDNAKGNLMTAPPRSCARTRPRSSRSRARCSCRCPWMTGPPRPARVAHPPTNRMETHDERRTDPDTRR